MIPLSPTPSLPSMFRPPHGARRDCPLCCEAGGRLIWQGDALRVIGVDDAAFPAFYRVVWRAHVAEFGDLTPVERELCMDAVVRVESALRRALSPTKVNLAQFGNVVPHLHWHVIARFEWDSHFPQPVWGVAQRIVDPPAVSRLALPSGELDAQVADALTGLDA
jgi:diadenosine tetraphosphate (Ap4A) HIT family hydrolase